MTRPHPVRARTRKPETVEEMRAPILAHFERCSRCEWGWPRRDVCATGDRLHRKLIRLLLGVR